MVKQRVVIVGAAGFLAGRVLSAFRERYDLVLLDVRTTNRAGEEVEGIVIADLVDPNRDAYREHFRARTWFCTVGPPVRTRDRRSSVRRLPQMMETFGFRVGHQVVGTTQRLKCRWTIFG